MGLESELAQLAEPLSADSPCGENLEDTPTLAAFDAYRLFGLLTPLENEPDWRELKEKSLEVLQQSKDFRLLAHLLAAVLRTGTLQESLQILVLADDWLTRYWDEVYPRLDEDAIMRRNALACLADRIAIIDALRRKPFVTHRQLGSFSLRDLDIATGALAATEDNPPSEAQIQAALMDADKANLQTLHDAAVAARKALANMEETMRTRGGGSEAVPDFGQLAAQIARIPPLLSPHLAQAAAPADDAGAAAEGESANANAGAATVIAVGSIRSREDAVRALDAVAEYFRKNEPSSPVPLMVDRAKRMVSMSFLEVLAELAPDGLDQARRAAGVPAE
ncbi:MAG TPA: type VI secretion system protein TssA [Steroidobacteraceae bacterium]